MIAGQILLPEFSPDFAGVLDASGEGVLLVRDSISGSVAVVHGTHAAREAFAAVKCDAARYKAYFPAVTLICPSAAG